MADEPPRTPRNDPVHRIAGFGTRAAARAVRPFADVILDGPEIERLLDDPQILDALRRARPGARGKRAPDIIIEGGLVDELLEQLLTRPALCPLVDELVASPAVTAAITQQSLGFADLIGAEIRGRARRADDWLERRGRRGQGGAGGGPRGGGGTGAAPPRGAPPPEAPGSNTLRPASP